MKDMTDEQIAAIVADVGMRLVKLMMHTAAGMESSLPLDAFGEQWIVSVKRVARTPVHAPTEGTRGARKRRKP